MPVLHRVSGPAEQPGLLHHLALPPPLHLQHLPGRALRPGPLRGVPVSLPPAPWPGPPPGPSLAPVWSGPALSVEIFISLFVLL